MLKRSAILMVVNGEPFIKPQLYHIYNMVDEVIIIEGAEATYKKVIHSSRSTDKTIDIIRKFIRDHDHAKKMKLIFGNHKDKNVIVREANKLCTGDLIYHIDVDEFLTHDIIDMSFSILNKRDCVLIPERWYYKWPDAHLKTGRVNGYQACPGRFFRNKIDKGLSISHIPWNGYVDQNYKHHVCSSAELENKYYGYHFLAIYRKQLEDKMKYYMLRDNVPEYVVAHKLKDFDITTRLDIGKKRIASYDNALLSLEEKPIALFKNGQFDFLLTPKAYEAEKCQSSLDPGSENSDGSLPGGTPPAGT